MLDFKNDTPSDVMKQIANTPAEPGSMVFWWLGQMGLAVKTHSKMLLFDPFLSEHPKRISRPPFGGRDVVGADIVFGSHDHDDHIDFPAWLEIAGADAATVFAVPGLTLLSLAGRGLPAARMVGVEDGIRTEISGIAITGIASSHEFLDRDSSSGQYPYMGYLVEADGFILYHPGDTCVYDGLAAKLKGRRIDLCILPINGRDAVRYSRGIIGNMTYQEAADLAGTLNPRLTIPGHYDMIEGNTADPQLFESYLAVKYPEAKHCLPAYCRPFWLHR